MGKHISTVVFVFSILLSAVSCAGIGEVEKPTPTPPAPLSSQESEEIAAAWHKNRGGEYTFELIARYGNLKLVRVLESGREGSRTARIDAAGMIIMVYGINVFGEEELFVFDQSGPYGTMFYTIPQAYLFGFISRQDVFDARDRLVAMGLATPADQLPEALTDIEMSGIETAYGQSFEMVTSGMLEMDLVGRYGGMPVVHMREFERTAHEGGSFEVAGIAFKFISSGAQVMLYDGSGLTSLQQAYGTGRMTLDDLKDARNNLVQMHVTGGE